MTKQIQLCKNIETTIMTLMFDLIDAIFPNLCSQ